MRNTEEKQRKELAEREGFGLSPSLTRHRTLLTVTTIIPPRALPKLQLQNGIPDELRTVVAVPTILSSEQRVRDLVDALEVRYLANRDKNLYFALLTDLEDAPDENGRRLEVGRRAEIQGSHGIDR